MLISKKTLNQDQDEDQILKKDEEDSKFACNGTNSISDNLAKVKRIGKYMECWGNEKLFTPLLDNSFIKNVRLTVR